MVMALSEHTFRAPEASSSCSKWNVTGLHPWLKLSSKDEMPIHLSIYVMDVHAPALLLLHHSKLEVGDLYT
jgi:hypothetical protein